MGNRSGNMQRDSAPGDGAPGEQSDADQSMAQFREFGMALVKACAVAAQEGYPVCLFADPDLDGMCAMYALARAMRHGLSKLDVRCYQLPNGTHNKADALDAYIERHYDSAPIGVFMDVMPMADDNVYVQVPERLRESYCIDHHKKNMDKVLDDERLVVCDPCGLATSGMVYHIIDQCIDDDDTRNDFRTTWRLYLSIANYADLGYRHKDVGYRPNERADDRHVLLLGGDNDDALTNDNSPTTMPFAVKCKFNAWTVISSGVDVKRGEARIQPMDKNFAKDAPVAFRRETANAAVIESVYCATIAWYKTPAHWKEASFVGQERNTLLDTETTYTVATSKGDLWQFLGYMYPDIPPYLCRDIAECATTPFQMQLTRDQDKKRNNMMDAAYSGIVGAVRRDFSHDKHIWLIYLEVGHGSANVRRLGSKRSCAELAKVFGGNGHDYAAGMGGFVIEDRGSNWRIHKSDP